MNFSSTSVNDYFCYEQDIFKDFIAVAKKIVQLIGD